MSSVTARELYSDWAKRMTLARIMGKKHVRPAHVEVTPEGKVRVDPWQVSFPGRAF